MKKNAAESFRKLEAVMRKLLSPEGCPWDKAQTHASLLKHLYEEADEAAGAVRKKDWHNLKEELGDILLQVVFHAELARRKRRFDLAGVVDGITKKLVRRHPHVFGGKKLSTPKEVLIQWEKIKKEEKSRPIKPKNR